MINNSYQFDIEMKEFKKVNNNLKRSFNIKFNKDSIIIINLLFFILLAIYIVEQKKISKLQKSFETKLKIIDKKISIMNFQIESFYLYLNTIKNKSSIYQIIKPKKVLGKKKIRIGEKSDGGYILLNDFDNIKIAYSFGISDEISFDKDLADKNIDVFMYDHTIEKLPFQNSKFHWKKIGLTEKKGIHNNMKTLDELIKENGHENEKNMILKLDIEGSEWNVLYYINKEILMHFKYIIIEFHFEKLFKSLFLKVLNKLNKTHQIFHLHCNNLGSLINIDEYNICSSLEVSYIIKENYSFLKTHEFYPVKNIDFKNNASLDDYNNFLNIYQIDNILTTE